MNNGLKDFGFGFLNIVEAKVADDEPSVTKTKKTKSNNTNLPMKKITKYAQYGDIVDDVLDCYEIIEDSREEKLRFITETSCHEDDELEDFDWEGDLEDFLNGNIDEITYDYMGQSEDPCAYTFRITTYDDELTELEDKIKQLKKDFGIE